ncbi:MAG TPA: hypothetical protein PLS67_14100 [Accumulibacter sp.]|jgi:hypothetical protein|nr:hypothetical protein [Accumulibacter sp.]HQC81621.1 hypothetical protein [Accumulibacter sp.]
MRTQNSRRRRQLSLLGLLILVAGLSAAAWIFATAADDASEVIGYEIVNGERVPIGTSDSKAYRHDLERFGGKAAVFADDFNRWLAGLWHGKRLAVLLAILAFGVSYVCLRAAERMPPDTGVDENETDC